MNAETHAALALVRLGVPVGTVETAMRALSIDEHDDATSVDAKVAQLKAEIPALFTAPAPAPRHPSQRPHLVPVPAGQVGADRARARERLGLAPTPPDAA